MENLKSLIKKGDKNASVEDDSLASESTRYDRSFSEEEILKKYEHFLQKLNAKVDNTFSAMSKESFLKLMKEKSLEMSKSQEKRDPNAKKSIIIKQNSNTNLIAKKKEEKEEDYFEDEEDKKLKDLFNEVLDSQKRAAILEKQRLEKEKELENKKKIN